MVVNASVWCVCLLKARGHGTSWLYNSVSVSTSLCNLCVYIDTEVCVQYNKLWYVRNSAAALSCVYPVETSTMLYNLYVVKF